MECGEGLSRGSDFFKMRHFQQVHPGIDDKKAVTLIVEANHELAIRKRKALAQSVAEEIPQKTKKKTSGMTAFLLNLLPFMFSRIVTLQFHFQKLWSKVFKRI